MRDMVAFPRLMRGALLVAGLWCVATAGALRAEKALDDATGALWDALRMERMIGVMRREGLSHSRELAEEMLPDGGSAYLRDRVEDIHEPGRLARMVRARFAAGLSGVDTAPLVAFFTSAEGREIIELEFAARVAMLDPETEEAARARYRALVGEASQDVRLEATRAYVRANDLIERNVTGALNANMSFMFGLIEGGALSMSREQAIRSVRADAGDVRRRTREWVYSYVLLAQDPLSVAQIRDYAALAATPEGRALNGTLFAAFGAMYREVSHALGRALAAEMAAQDL
ncbi:hypothetical protein [Sediminimonas qiaohouensis]|uniref:hypothetical protein n=1 Tax=Sediminimonas qiaohouensis TaxID=552061 RepID=UPI0004105106|nr:hypothetical protein [Sediminimonas qiaohouensis]